MLSFDYMMNESCDLSETLLHKPWSINKDVDDVEDMEEENHRLYCSYSSSFRQRHRHAIAHRVHVNPYALEDAEAAARRMRRYEALDYESPHSDVHTLQQLRQSKREVFQQTVANWSSFACVGLTVGLTAFVINIAVEALTAAKFSATQKLLDDDRNASAFAVWIGISLAFGLVAALLVVCVEKTAAGSGIPEVKAFLNGTNTPRFLTPVAGVVKCIGVAFSVSSGLIIGKEGPLIHIGAVVGNLFAVLPKCKQFAKFRNDRFKRDFVSAGAAAGVAAAFSAPTGGICFALEEAASYWRLSLTWRAFFCTMLTTSTLWIVTAFSEGKSSFWGYVKFGSWSNESLFEIWEIPFMAVLSVAGGLAGAAFCAMNAKLSLWRATHVNPFGSRRVLEVLFIVGLTATAAFWLPFLLDDCAEATPDFQCTHLDNRYYCGGTEPLDPVPASCVVEGDRTVLYNCTDVSVYVAHRCEKGREFNTYATVAFASTEDAIHAFFHDAGHFDKFALAVYFVVTFLLAMLTYGCAVPSGLFVPCILCGSAFGRLWGEMLRDWFPGSDVHPGVFALVGSAAMLSGVTRITITLSVILFETTNQVYLITPLMLTVLVAKWIADQFNISLYDIHIALKCLPFVEPEPPLALQGLTAREIMQSPCVVLEASGTVAVAVEVLARVEHNGFPVVDSMGRYCGCIQRNWLIVLLRRRHWRLPTDPPASGDERSLLTPSDFDADNSLQSKILSVDDIDLDEVPPGAVLDLWQYLNPATVTVTELCPVARCFALFRSLGIRHMPVLSLDHKVVGIITRQEVSTDFSQDLF